MMSMSVNVTTNSPSQEYTPPHDHTSWTYGYNFKEKMELCLNKHALNFALFSFQFSPAFFKFEFIKFGLSYLGRLFIRASPEFFRFFSQNLKQFEKVLFNHVFSVD